MSPQITRWAAMAAVLSGIAFVAAPAAASAAKARGLVAAIKILPDKAPDCSSLKSIVASITRECKTNDEKAIAIYNFMQLSHYHFAYPGEPGGLPVLKEINCYGWSLCGGLHSEESALWRQLGWGWRFVGWDGHTTVEANYDGKWHYLDVFLKFYAWKPDQTAPGGRTIAGEDELTKRSEELIKNAFVLDQARKCVYAKNNQFGRYGNTGLLAGPGILVLRRRIGGCDRRAEDAPSRRARRRLGGYCPRRQGLLGRRQPCPGFFAYQYLGSSARRLVLERQQESARAHLRRSQGHAERPGHRAGAGAVYHEQASPQLRQRHAHLCCRLLQRGRAQVVCRGGECEVCRQLAGSRRERQARHGGGRSGQPLPFDQGPRRGQRRRCGRSLYRRRQDVPGRRPDGLYRRRPRPGGGTGQVHLSSSR